MAQTSRRGLPYIVTSQAQKEVTHNAIRIISYERQIKTLEEQRLVLQEWTQKCGEFDSTVTETAIG